MTKYLTSRASAFESNTGAVDTSAETALMTRAFDTEGGEWVYLLGVASTAAGSWASWNLSTCATALLAANAVGLVGIAGAATVASTYGWYQIWGYNSSSASDTVASAALALYIDGTAGRVDDTDVAGDVVIGAYSAAADTSNVLPVWITYPHVTNIAID